MKTSRILLAAAVTFCMTACNEDAQFDKELYKKVINVLSDDNLVFSVNHDLNKYRMWRNPAYRYGCIGGTGTG